MEFASIRNIEVPVSRIGLGTWSISGWMWGGCDQATSIKTIRAALDNGINLIDTAPVYGFGLSEKLVGQALAEHGSRDQVVVATKTGLAWGSNGVRRDSSPARLRAEVDDSLRRLQVEYIDLYQVHWPDATVPIEATAEALAELQEAGKIRALGVSNYSVEQMDRFRAVVPLDTIQPPFNLFEQDAGKTVVPHAQELGISKLAYGALCRGLLSGRMSGETPFAGDDLRRNDIKFKSPLYAQYLDAVSRLDALAHQRFGKRVLHLALRWILDNGVEIALLGARRPEHIQPVADVMGWGIDVDVNQEIATILGETIVNPCGSEFLAPPG
jgi:aryl-alcohol dehydrogenase-like predicted oxidoreductase